jgi:hypothetical protein
MIVQDIVELYGDLHRRRERLSALRTRQGKRNRGADDPYEEEILQMESELESDVERLQAFVDELQQIGVELKDPLTGLVDFRTEINGREACLCWRLGEDEIRHWHELDAGFAGRQSLAEVEHVTGESDDLDPGDPGSRRN